MLLLSLALTPRASLGNDLLILSREEQYGVNTAAPGYNIDSCGPNISDFRLLTVHRKDRKGSSDRNIQHGGQMCSRSRKIECFAF